MGESGRGYAIEAGTLIRKFTVVRNMLQRWVFDNFKYI